MTRIYLVAPTFREKDSVKKLLKSLACQSIDMPFTLVLCNSNPRDETSVFLLNNSFEFPVLELEGSSTEFWSGAVNRGLIHVSKIAKNSDIVIILNVDIYLDDHALKCLVDFMESKNFHCQAGGLGYSDGFYVPSGFRIINKWFALNYHPFAGKKINSIEHSFSLPVDAVVGRLFAFPVSAISKAGFIPENRFPHYNADLVYSFMLSRAGYSPYIVPSASYFSDRDNTGLSVYSNKKIGFFDRIKLLFSLKNPSNPIYRSKYIFEVFPFYMWPTVFSSYFAKSFLEVFLGGRLIKIIFGKVGRGY